MTYELTEMTETIFGKSLTFNFFAMACLAMYQYQAVLTVIDAIEG